MSVSVLLLLFLLIALICVGDGVSIGNGVVSLIVSVCGVSAGVGIVNDGRLTVPVIDC